MTASALAKLPLDAAVSQHLNALIAALFSQKHLPAPTLELCRLRLAQLHRTRAAALGHDVAMDAQKIENLADWHRHPAFSALERACLAFTEVYSADVQAVSDELADAVKAHCGDAGLVALIEALGLFDGMLRTEMVWGYVTTAGSDQLEQ